jgi:hypothetical protein
MGSKTNRANGAGAEPCTDSMYRPTSPRQRRSPGLADRWCAQHRTVLKVLDGEAAKLARRDA